MKTGIAKQIIGSFEDIGKDVAREVVKAPVDIAGTMLESIGMSKGTGGTGSKSQKSVSPLLTPEKDSSLGKLDDTKDNEVKKKIARAALEQISQQPKKEPSVWEIKEKEEEEKKKREKELREVESKQLPKMEQRKKRGNLYGVKQKQSPTEKMVNIKTD